LRAAKELLSIPEKPNFRLRDNDIALGGLSMNTALMTKVVASWLACSLVVCIRPSFAACQVQVESDRSHAIIEELTSHLPKGAVLSGKDLPASVKTAVRELVALSRQPQTVEDLTARVIVIRDMNRYLDYKGVMDARQRDFIKRFKTAFTIDEQFPIYLNGQSDLIAMAEARLSSEDGSVIYKLAAVIAHERVHAQGEPSERKAIEEEIRVLEIFVVRRLVELEWLTTRKTKLAQLLKGQVPDNPVKVNHV
jgi:hypothetical protein